MPIDPELPVRFISTPLGRFIVLDDDPANDLPDAGTPLPLLPAELIDDPPPGDKPPALPLRQRIQHKLRRHDPYRAELQQELQQARANAEAELHNAFAELRRHYANRASTVSVSPVDPAPIVEPDTDSSDPNKE